MKRGKKRCSSLSEKITYDDLDVKYGVHCSVIQHYHEQCRDQLLSHVLLIGVCVEGLCVAFFCLFAFFCLILFLFCFFFSGFNKDGSEKLDHPVRLNCTS